MNKLAISAIIAGAAALGGCAAVPAAPAQMAAGGPCGTYGYVDVNNDGWISGSEWNTYRTSTYANWDVNRDGRVDRSEFENCWRAGGFYRDAYYYSPDYWNTYWTAFDANGDGWLSADEYWSTNAWNSLDRNRNGRIDQDEWWRG
jgi:hypothetical protein